VHLCFYLFFTVCLAAHSFHSCVLFQHRSNTLVVMWMLHLLGSLASNECLPDVLRMNVSSLLCVLSMCVCSVPQHGCCHARS
jgi:hypothetical protein